MNEELEKLLKDLAQALGVEPDTLTSEVREVVRRMVVRAFQSEREVKRLKEGTASLRERLTALDRAHEELIKVSEARYTAWAAERAQLVTDRNVHMLTAASARSTLAKLIENHEAVLAKAKGAF